MTGDEFQNKSANKHSFPPDERRGAGNGGEVEKGAESSIVCAV